MNRSTTFFLLFSFLLIASGCKLADLRTSSITKEGITPSATEKGKALLEHAWKTQGLDQLRTHKVYAVEAEDHWRGAMGKVAKLWPEPKIDLSLKYAINTFDSQVEFKSGERKGMIAGLQSWQYYEQPVGGDISFEVESNANTSFGLAAFQYFFELSDRLKDAPIISYAGSHEALGAKYDLVFVTWDSPEPHQQHDHYRLWINQENHRLEVAEYTIRDAPQNLPGAQALYGSIWFQDFREIDGIQIPFQQYVFANSPNKNPEKYLHKLTVSSFVFDSFDPKILYPNSEIDRVGDDKVVTAE